jgi:hypothetical protein
MAKCQPNIAGTAVAMVAVGEQVLLKKGKWTILLEL